MCVRGGAVCLGPPGGGVGRDPPPVRSKPSAATGAPFGAPRVQDHGFRPTVCNFLFQTLGGHRHTFRRTAWQDHGFRPTVSIV